MLLYRNDVFESDQQVQVDADFELRSAKDAMVVDAGQPSGDGEMGSQQFADGILCSLVMNIIWLVVSNMNFMFHNNP